MKCKICQQNEVDSTSGICWKCCGESKVKPIEKFESFGEECIRTGHRLFGGQGVDGSKYRVDVEGQVYRLLQVYPLS